MNVADNAAYIAEFVKPRDEHMLTIRVLTGDELAPYLADLPPGYEAATEDMRGAVRVGDRVVLRAKVVAVFSLWVPIEVLVEHEGRLAGATLDLVDPTTGDPIVTTVQPEQIGGVRTVRDN